MKKINMDIEVKELDGKAAIDPRTGRPLKLSEMVAGFLASSRSEGAIEAIKMTTIARAFYEKGEASLDEADLKLITEKIEKTDAFVNLVKAQILEAFK